MSILHNKCCWNALRCVHAEITSKPGTRFSWTKECCWWAGLVSSGTVSYQYHFHSSCWYLWRKLHYEENYALGTLVHARIWAPGSTATAWSTNAVLWAQELDCFSRASVELELKRKEPDGRWFQNKQTTNTPENRWEKPKWDEHD